VAAAREAKKQQEKEEKAKKEAEKAKRAAERAAPKKEKARAPFAHPHRAHAHIPASVPVVNRQHTRRHRCMCAHCAFIDPCRHCDALAPPKGNIASRFVRVWQAADSADLTGALVAVAIPNLTIADIADETKTFGNLFIQSAVRMCGRGTGSFHGRRWPVLPKDLIVSFGSAMLMFDTQAVTLSTAFLGFAVLDAVLNRVRPSGHGTTWLT
jgi:hypothetical protein